MLKKVGIGCGALIAIVVVIIVIAAIAGGGGDDEAQRPDVSPTPVPTPITVTAKQIYEDYESNEVVAKAKYEGNWALITGTISSITEAGSKYDVKLETDEIISFSHIVCKIDKEHEAEVLSLAAEQTVAVLGRIKGKSIVDIDVEDCRIQ